MSVSMLKRTKDGSAPDEWVDIATNKFFESHWLPIAERLRLKLVPQLWDPYQLVEEERLLLINELGEIQGYIRSEDIDPRAASMSERIDQLSRVLSSANCDACEFSFG